jgi:hypothetical protein
MMDLFRWENGKHEDVEAGGVHRVRQAPRSTGKKMGRTRSEVVSKTDPNHAIKE